MNNLSRVILRLKALCFQRVVVKFGYHFMLLEQGKLASIAARIDRMVTKRKGEVPIDNYRKDYA
ncbi:MAG: hypothetical protein ACJ788_02975, partial [Ktedonobacteraceae bacterium]